MVTIHKYEIPVTETSVVELPVGCRVLGFREKSVNVHTITAAIWAVVDTDAPLRPVRFEMRESGGDASGLEDLTYLGTFRRLAETFHVFASLA